jgi:phage recombination protein Bet
MSALITLSNQLAEKFGMGNDSKVLETLKQTVFKSSASDAQMIALLVVANQYSLNPWTKEIYAFPDSKNGGVIPVVGVDGWSRIINDHPQLNGISFNESPTSIELHGSRPCPEWMECVIHRKDRSHPVIVREYLDEVYRPAYIDDKGRSRPGPWQSHTKRFLRHKTLIQCARLAFGYTGIYDEDEAHRIKDMGMVEIVALDTQEWIDKVDKSESLAELENVWKTGNQKFLDAKVDNKQFKYACNLRKKELIDRDNVEIIETKENDANNQST